MIRNILRVVIPILLLGLGILGIRYFLATRPPVETTETAPLVPVVRTITAEEEDIRLTVVSQGTVGPRTVTALVPEIAGKVVYTSPSLVDGGFFEEGEVLLRIDPNDYHLAIAQAESAVAQARLNLEQEKAEALVARQEWEELGNEEPASPLVLREPQIAYAEASLESAIASLEMARRNLEKTEIKAPYAGRVSEKNVDIGQYVSPGVSLAQLYAVDVAEVRIPLPDADLAYIDLPLKFRDEEDEENKGPEVKVSTRFAGKDFTWEGRIVRTEGEIDPATRMLYAVVQVEDPYGRGRNPDKPPLAVGMFVETEILGHWVEDAVSLPRSAVREGDVVWVVGNDNRLEFREVEVLKSEPERFIISDGIEDGELICVSSLEAVVEGMEVRIAEDDPEGEDAL